MDYLQKRITINNEKALVKKLVCNLGAACYKICFGVNQPIWVILTDCDGY